MKVEIVGGPLDGMQWELASTEVRVLEERHPVMEIFDEATTISAYENYVEYVMPVRLTRDGYRAYWSERKPST